MTPLPVSGSDSRPPAGRAASSPPASASRPSKVSGRHSRLNQSRGWDVNEVTVLMTIRSSRTL